MVVAMIGGCARPAPTASIAPVAPPMPLSEGAASEAEPAEISSAVLHGLLSEGAVEFAHDDTGLPPGRLRYRVCLDRAGVASTTPWPVREPRYEDLDRRIRAQIAIWRFRPLVRDGAAVAACSTFHVDVAMPGPSRSEPAALLPPIMVELPRPTILRMARPAGVARPPTPGVGIVVRCMRPGSDTAPVASLVQSSGDDAVDALALHVRALRRPDAPSTEELSCAAFATIAGVAPPEPEVPSPEPAAAPPPPAAAIVAPRALDQVRISGDARIVPSPTVKLEIADSGQSELVIPVKVCVAVDGKVDAVSILKSSGFLAYDIELLNVIGGWSYRPFLIDGHPAPVCSIVQFRYRQVPAEE